MRRGTFEIWVVAALGCLTLMWVFPGEETVPYHVGYALFALSFGLAPWTVQQTAGALIGYTALSGFVLVLRAQNEVIAWEETAEIPLMLTLVLLMVWLVRRREKALEEITWLSEQERLEARARDLLTRRSSHEMRSPLTISRGYLELLRARPRDPSEAEELQIVAEELERLTRVCDRLVRAFQVHGDIAVTPVDLDAMLAETLRRWSTVADREWVLQSAGGVIPGSPERLRAALDTLIENAVRYTEVGDVVRLRSLREPGGAWVRLSVADSGPGLTDEQADRINSTPALLRDPADHEVDRDALSQTGLGMGIVLEVVERRGDRLQAARAPEGGAELTLVLPAATPAAHVLPVPAAPTSTTWPVGQTA
ncbi:MAG TPA: HAMP domain-containing sensor histidine kinase [Segeticoccus sp.]|uniref:sensor histidine kinase n=1 Tax=Segeticoccus sp. TaxID=2706531 RepID=UPI002D7FE9E1|nr:HAMP domain-containing sensor histidine kinase [Segeticoccus sp.]HET8599102.1 HAMP domain-containing sensor histidine kinase [Segeticoccus sp.]